ncbi:AMMECR1 domain protein [Pyrobaculum islandicum DSM 4184]|uniref:Protein Pisl_1005 n=1 Tax=Pyrobaculum islandicum (strain DSM 4184 / JCM 9189 / GEO3) TaxID=384616 RepID=Y1005_PYRIL|nr:TIGR00296 family protein [Pyrobaculum islandicum]A1RT97.1 RecName: Full=Protein Pisl_1005 [Pyrobaculum islandicum DSM 4184]ABL88179.1 AMMECR1 domain protein [Pyrobaculum islandicum DSM 4184]
MFRPYTIEEGAYLVKLARSTVETFLKTGKIIIPESPPQRLLIDNYGVFTTIETVSGDRYELRGCIGYPEGYKNTLYATIYSAIGACCQDPRFPALRIDELPHVIFEVSILSPLTLLQDDPRKYPELIQVGRHGLVVRRGPYAGLLLPQVAVEECWDAEEFLLHVCMKAWLPGDCWLDRRTKLYIYEAQIFREKTPGGEIYERNLVAETAKCSPKTRRENEQ